MWVWDVVWCWQQQGKKVVKLKGIWTAASQGFRPGSNNFLCTRLQRAGGGTGRDRWTDQLIIIYRSPSPSSRIRGSPYDLWQPGTRTREGVSEKRTKSRWSRAGPGKQQGARLAASAVPNWFNVWLDNLFNVFKWLAPTQSRLPDVEQGHPSAILLDSALFGHSGGPALIARGQVVGLLHYAIICMLFGGTNSENFKDGYF